MRLKCKRKKDRAPHSFPAASSSALRRAFISWIFSRYQASQNCIANHLNTGAAKLLAYIPVKLGRRK